nr:MAG TPA: DNA encapsidation protein [Caudoviricetes sp.]
MDIMEKLLGEGDYYDYGRVLSYHAPWMFVIGARGLGKTYGAKKLVIGDWIKKLWQLSFFHNRSALCFAFAFCPVFFVAVPVLPSVIVSVVFCFTRLFSVVDSACCFIS